jgi:hypothetical protein
VCEVHVNPNSIHHASYHVFFLPCGLAVVSKMWILFLVNTAPKVNFQPVQQNILPHDTGMVIQEHKNVNPNSIHHASYHVFFLPCGLAVASKMWIFFLANTAPKVNFQPVQQNILPHDTGMVIQEHKEVIRNAFIWWFPFHDRDDRITGKNVSQTNGTIKIHETL